MPINFIYSSRFLEYKEAGHPESPERLKAIVDFLEKKKVGRFIVPQECTEEDLLLVHSKELVNNVMNNLLPYDPDTPNIKNIYRYAVLSCGASLEACRLALRGQMAFALSRPPGHHTGRNRIGGFCYFNNMAVAIKKNVLNKGIKAAILDIDGHHGNGTEEIFKGMDNIIYVSIHQFPSFPGTGSTSFGNCYNFPVYVGSTAETYMEKFKSALNVISEFSPEIIGISAGFDTHIKDPLLQMPLEDKHYYFMGKAITAVEGKKFIILEGGYNVSTIGHTCYCFIKGLMKEKNQVGEKQGEEKFKQV